MRYNIIGDSDIDGGKATDAYFERVEETLEHAGKNPDVVAEVTVDQFGDGKYSVLAGLDDAVALFENVPVTVEALPEGTLFDGGPVMRISGDYLSFARLETALLGFLSHASGVATRAFEATQAAPDTSVLSFGARHVNPAIGGMIERSAVIGGVDGYSFVAAEDSVGFEPSGTMPHALMLCYGQGNQAQAFSDFNDAVDETVPRIALCDTFEDEVDEVIRAVETFGDELDGVRLDTTGSRRGDFEHIIKEVQYKLNAYGYPDVDIYVSGGLGPADMKTLREHVDGFGIGGYISKADPVDFSLDIVDIEGKPIAKRGKLPGVKDVYRTETGHEIVPAGNSVHKASDSLFETVVEDGEVTQTFAPEDAVQQLKQDADILNYDPHQ